MESTKAFELKVGVFIMIGVAILFAIVFSIGDIYFIKPGYHVTVSFNFASGIGPSAPVRLAGVGVGQVEGIQIVYDEAAKRSKAKLHVWIKEEVKIENDAVITINTLGLLGEKYLEIFPGTSGNPFMKDSDEVAGKDPVTMEKITDNLAKLSDSITSIADKIDKGQGTIGKLLNEDGVYYDLKAITGNVKDFTAFLSEKVGKGEGTIGKLLAKDEIYYDLKAISGNFKDFSEDLKRHPWKLLARPKEVSANK